MIISWTVQTAIMGEGEGTYPSLSVIAISRSC